MSTRTVWRAGIGIIAGILCLGLALGAQAQISNNPPQITSAPTLTVTAGTPYTYVAAATDDDGDTLTWNLSVAPADMTLSGSTLTWGPTVTGIYNTVLEVTDGNNGYDSQTWQISVIPGAVARITVEPNDRPTIVNNGSNKQFVATAYDAYGNIVPTPDITWTTDATYGSVSSDGLFTAKQGGITYVAAQSGEVKQSNGVVVSDVAGNILKNVNTNAPLATNTNTETNANTNEATNANTNTDTNVNAAANTNEAVTNDNTNADTEEMTGDEEMTELPAADEAAMSEEVTDDEPCTNMAHWAIILILVLYGVAIILYYRYEKTAPTSAWWILPTLLTIIALIIYYQNICPGEYLWWPWTMVGIGAITTIYYKGRRSDTDDGSDLQDTLPM